MEAYEKKFAKLDMYEKLVKAENNWKMVKIY